MINNNIHTRPCTKLSLPVGYGGQGGNDEEGSTDPHVEYFIQKSDGLNGLSQTHFIRQYTIFSRESKDSMEKSDGAVRGIYFARIIKYRKYTWFPLVHSTQIVQNIIH